MTVITQVPAQAAVNKAVGALTPRPNGMAPASTTSAIESPWLRLCIHGDIDSRKTSTAASFAAPEDTRIILTRGEDQLLPIRSLGIKYQMCKNLKEFQYAAMYPEQIWPEWAGLPNRTLIFDDITKAKELALDDNDDGQNNMLVYREATKDIGSIFKSVFSKPQHVIAIALTTSYENDISHEENLTPDLPPSMRRMLMADFSFVFYIDKTKKVFFTSEHRQTWQGMDEKMRAKVCTRIIFARHKLPKELEGKGIIAPEEPLDVAAIWKKVREAK